MKIVLLICLLVVFTEVESAKKTSKKCPVAKTSRKQFYQFTVTKKVGKGKKRKIVPVANQPCWFNLKSKSCAKCKPNGKQCGYPMHKWCQSKNSKVGCPGIPRNKYTLSTRGYPCYWDMTKNSCAWCKSNGRQCKERSTDKCGSHCDAVSSARCDGVATTCTNIDQCGIGATCDKKSERCRCNKGLSGNGMQCYNRTTGNPAIDPMSQVQMGMTMKTEFEVYPHQSYQFSVPVNLVASNTGSSEL